MSDASCQTVRGVRARGSKLFVEGCGYLEVISEVSVVESDGLIGDYGRFLPRKASEKAPEV